MSLPDVVSGLLLSGRSGVRITSGTPKEKTPYGVFSFGPSLQNKSLALQIAQRLWQRQHAGVIKSLHHITAGLTDHLVLSRRFHAFTQHPGAHIVRQRYQSFQNPRALLRHGIQHHASLNLHQVEKIWFVSCFAVSLSLVILKNN